MGRHHALRAGRERPSLLGQAERLLGVESKRRGLHVVIGKHAAFHAPFFAEEDPAQSNCRSSVRSCD
jgi:hypothetical protein